MEISKEQKEAIEELEEFIKGPCETCKYCESAYKLNRKNIIQLLNLNKKLQKENEELEEINNELEAEKNEAIRRYNFETIPIKKVKDKIEYLEDYIEENSDEQGYWGNINPNVIYGQKEILEEILKLESE